MTDFAHSLAVLIGIDACSNGIPRLTTAVNDAARQAGLLADAHDMQAARSGMLRFRPAASSCPSNRGASVAVSLIGDSGISLRLKHPGHRNA
jgi:hypothetical protein